MNFILRGIYLFLVQPLMVFFALTLGSIFNKKIQKGLHLRKLMPWSELPSNMQPIWIHCSSGEFEYAKPVIRNLKLRDPSCKILVSFFSPTYASAIAKDPNVDYSCPLPFDLPAPSKDFLKHINPKVLLIARTDVWPELTFQCRALNIKTVLFSMTFNKNINFVSKIIHNWRLSNIDKIFTTSAADKDNLLKLNLSAKIESLGDTRFDQAFFRINSDHTELKKDLLTSEHPLLIAGSTWQEDEQVLIPAVRELLNGNKIRLIIAPHEPTEVHLKNLSKQLNKEKLTHQLYSNSNLFNQQVLIIDTVGVLANIYPNGELAFVGGSFKSSVHSVMEPLVAGNIVFVGPHIKNNREAITFSNAPVKNNVNFVNVANNSNELCKIIESSIALNAKNKIAEKMSSECGASKKLVEKLINQNIF